MCCRVPGAVVSGLFVAVGRGSPSSHTLAFPRLSQFPLFGSFAAWFHCFRSTCPVPHCCRTSSSSGAAQEQPFVLSSLMQTYDAVRIPLFSHLPANTSAAVLESSSFPLPNSHLSCSIWSPWLCPLPLRCSTMYLFYSYLLFLLPFSRYSKGNVAVKLPYMCGRKEGRKRSDFRDPGDILG